VQVVEAIREVRVDLVARREPEQEAIPREVLEDVAEDQPTVDGEQRAAAAQQRVPARRPGEFGRGGEVRIAVLLVLGDGSALGRAEGQLPADQTAFAGDDRLTADG